MSGHSKWSTIKHRKANQDARRAKLFTKLIREITVAARAGGEDLQANSRLRLVVLQARSHNMPNNTIQRAIKKGVGGGAGTDYQKARYEGYGPGKVAVMVEVLTDNRNRTAATMRAAFSKFGGSLGGANSVQHLFVLCGVIRVETDSEDQLTELAIEVGAEDLKQSDGFYQVFCASNALEQVSNQLTKKGFIVKETAVEWVATTEVEIEQEEVAQQVLELLKFLEEDDDVQRIFCNLKLPEALSED